VQSFLWYLEELSERSFIVLYSAFFIISSFKFGGSGGIRTPNGITDLQSATLPLRFYTTYTVAVFRL
jgi:hypothetical protein